MFPKYLGLSGALLIGLQNPFRILTPFFGVNALPDGMSGNNNEVIQWFNPGFSNHVLRVVSVIRQLVSEGICCQRFGGGRSFFEVMGEVEQE